jgi:hypothetical protein
MLRRKLIIYVIPFCALYACVDHADITMKEHDARVDFTFEAADAVSSRATVSTTATLDRIGVFGYSHALAGGWAAGGAAATPDYFLNKMVVKKNGVWNYDGVTKYWPDAARSVSFFAYAPYVDNQNTFTVSPQAATAAGSPTIAYTVPTDVAKQTDLLYGVALDQVYGTNSGTVAFTMKHALACIDISVRLNPGTGGGDTGDQDRPFTVSVDTIQIDSIIPSGTLTPATAANPSVEGVWTVPAPAALTLAALEHYLLLPGRGLDATKTLFDAAKTGAAGEPDDFTYRTLNAEPDGHWLFIPQTLSKTVETTPSPVMLFVRYTVKSLTTGLTDAREASFDLSAFSDGKWEAGKAYNYQITLSATSGAKLELQVANFGGGSIEWMTGTESGSQTI